MSTDTVLQFVEISKAFPGVQALDKVSFDIAKGEVHAIVGENGAGKSTLMKITAGLYPHDNGQILLDGRPTQIHDAHTALMLGIAMVPQELNLVPEMTVAENLLLGMEPLLPIMGMVNRQELIRRAMDTMTSLRVRINPRSKIKRLTVAEQQMVQVGRALANQCKILIMDEPTAALSEREKVALFDRIRMLNQQGTTVIYISHRMEEIFEIADRITVLRDGRVTGTRAKSETNQEEILRLMIGRSMSEYLNIPKENQADQAVSLEIRNLSRIDLFNDISLKLHRGEVLGIAGLVGSRRTETFASVFGSPPPDSGVILVDGQPVKIGSPMDAIRYGIGYVPEERKKNGIFPIMTILENTTISFLQKLAQLAVVNQKQEAQQGKALTDQLRVQTPSLSRKIVYLSGGNQQKVILARWLGSGAHILILDEPTRGIDVNAKAEIHAIVAKLAADGKSIIYISSEMQELLAISDRIIVFHNGQIAGEVSPHSTTEEEILRLAMYGGNGNNGHAEEIVLES